MQTFYRFVPHGTIFSLTLAASLCNAQPERDADPAPEAPTLLIMATPSEEVAAQVNAGMLDVLMGWDESARLHFHEAVAADESCLLGWLGLMMVEGNTPELRERLAVLLSSDVAITPQETALAETLLRLVRGERIGAGEEFAARAERYRRDWLSACWAALLLHDGYDDAGNPLEGQRHALELMERVLAAYADNALCNYMRALLEETAPSPSEAALSAARRAVELLPGHPAPRLLLGHLSYRLGDWEGAAVALQEAVILAEHRRNNVPHGTISSEKKSCLLEYWPLEIRARLYLATVSAKLGKAGEYKAILASLKPDSSAGQGGSAALLHWEARTLPLRLLMLRTALPIGTEVAEAVRWSESFSLLPKDGSVRDYHDCLRFCVAARQLAATGKQQQALRCVKAAEDAFARLKEVPKGVESLSPEELSVSTRAREGCRAAILAAKVAVYPDTADIWLQCLEEAQRPAGYLLPPVLPR